MLYVGLYQSRLVGRLICPIFGEGCEGIADAPFARPFGIPDGYIGAVLYIVIIALLLSPPNRWGWIALLVLSGAATNARQCPRCARYDDLWRLLLLLPNDGVLVAGAAVVGMETRVIAE
ncbi:Vitamin K epoxide reductase family protein [Bradyrhizobium erythrophlei]|nr:Vitamin K epoxide reductase family protein [Bradyrhizobium erythrophlei]